MPPLRLALAAAFVLAACGADPEPPSPAAQDARETAPSSVPPSVPPATPEGPVSVPSPSPATPPDASPAPEPAAPNPYAGGVPIAASPGVWTYVPMSDVVCGNGTSSGIGINVSTTPGAPLLVFMMGGGACWDPLTCLGGTASNLDGEVGEAEVMGDVPRVAALFDRAAEGTPFRDATFVFVPYCTGDLHAGDAQKTYSLLTRTQTVQHRGARNTDAIVKRLLATFAAPPKIYLTGASGGGYGAMLNHHRFRTAWPTTRIDLLNDCGPPIQPAGSFWKDMQASWKLELPPGCAGCKEDVTKLLPHLATQMGQGRLALLGYTRDKTIRAFSGRVVPQDFENQMTALRGVTSATQRTYFISSDDHVLLKQKPLPVAPSGLSLSTWLARFASDDPAWAHEGP